jgi:hypothetical protein
MSEETTKPDGPIQRFTDSKTLKNYAGSIAILLGALPAVAAFVVSLVTATRGEPVAEKTWTTVRNELNRQADAVNKLHLRMVQLQAHEEGRTSAAIQLKLDDLQKRYDQLRAQVGTKELIAPVSPTAAVTKPETPNCRDGYIRIKDRCRSVSRDVAEKVKSEEQKTESMWQKLREEKLRRMREEKLRQKAEQTVKSVQTTNPMLRPLPKKLDDVKGN